MGVLPKTFSCVFTFRIKVNIQQRYFQTQCLPPHPSQYLSYGMNQPTWGTSKLMYEGSWCLICIVEYCPATKKIGRILFTGKRLKLEFIMLSKPDSECPSECIRLCHMWHLEKKLHEMGRWPLGSKGRVKLGTGMDCTWSKYIKYIYESIQWNYYSV